jgi:cytosine/adenosine deaminase-related metal-dependent hydrolase
MAHGWPPAVKALSYGLRPGLSNDVVTSGPGDMFSQMRALFGSERARRNEIAWTDDVDPTDLLTAREILGFATIDGAAVAGVADRTGSLTPGKKADIVIIDGHALNTAPVIDPVATVVTAADISNVETVIIDGRFHKRNGKMLADLDTPRNLVESSKDYLVASVPAQPGWLVREPA